MTKLFISYSRENLEFVQRLSADLQRSGIDVWVDRFDLLLLGTQDWEITIREAITESDVVLLIASPESVRSSIVRDEIALAQMHGKEIYPIWIGGEQWLDSIPLGMSKSQYLDMRDEKNYTHNLHKLIGAIASTVVKPEVQDLIPSTLEEGASEKVLFRAYSPHIVIPQRRCGLVVYSFTQKNENIISNDIDRFRGILGGIVPKPKTTKNTIKLAIGTYINVVPESDEIEFEPRSLEKKWHGDWTRFEFEFRPSELIQDETVFARISIQVAGIEVAHIKTAIEVLTLEDDESKPEETISNPLMNAKLQSKTVTPYQRIFISYSRLDSKVVRAYKLAQIALGNEAFLDVDNLRTGENWRAALARAIDDADVFQLFWSENSANSEHCRYEWDYALRTRCADKKCEGFIRPVYWSGLQPNPDPPTELSDFNFRYVPFENESPQ